MWDVTTAVGGPKLKVTGGYTYTTFNPYTFFDQAPPPPPGNPFFGPRDEITLGASSTVGAYRVSGFARRDLTNHHMVAVGADAAYEDECFILDLRFYRRYTSLNGDGGATALLFLFTFKTLGQVGYRAE